MKDKSSRAKIVFYVVVFTYLSLVFIMNGRTKTNVDLIFTEFEVSLILIFVVSILMGLFLGGLISNRKKSQLRKEIERLKNAHENKK